MIEVVIFFGSLLGLFIAPIVLSDYLERRDAKKRAIAEYLYSKDKDEQRRKQDEPTHIVEMIMAIYDCLDKRTQANQT